MSLQIWWVAISAVRALIQLNIKNVAVCIFDQPLCVADHILTFQTPDEESVLFLILPESNEIMQAISDQKVLFGNNIVS